METDLGKAKTKDFYQLLNKKTHMRCQTGTTKWNQTMQLDGETWKKIFTSLKNICKETKLKEFQFKCIHRIVVTKKELLIIDTESKRMMNAFTAVNTIHLASCPVHTIKYY